MLQQHAHLDRIIKAAAITFLLLLTFGAALAAPGDGFGYEVSNSTVGFSIAVTGEYTDSNGTVQKVNKTIVPAVGDTWEYEVTTGLYEARFQDSPSTTNTIALLRNGTEIRYDPNGVYWQGVGDDDIIDANPDATSEAVINENVLTYPDAYGTGIDLEYHYLTDRLKEYIVVDNRAVLGEPPTNGPTASSYENLDNVTFKHQYQVWKTAGTTLYVDEEPVLETNGLVRGTRAELRTSSNETIFKLEEPVATDANGDTVTGYYLFDQGASDVNIEQHFPYNWLDNATYPVRIDPTTAVQVNGTVRINLSEAEYDPLLEITLNNVTDDGEHSNTLYLDPIEFDELGVEDYGIDPSDVSFTNGTVNVRTAQGDFLYKCVTYNLTTKECVPNEQDGNSTWKPVQALVSGNSYEFTIDQIDPGYFEYQLASGEVTTTSTTYVNATTKNFTVDRQGTYVVMGTWAQRADKTNEYYYSRVLVDGQPISEVQRRAKDASPTIQYPSFTTHKLVNLSPGNHTVSLQYRVTGATNTFMKDMRLFVFNADTYDINQGLSSDPNTTTTLTTTPQNLTTLDVTPVVNGTFLNLGYVEWNYQRLNDFAYTSFFDGTTTGLNQQVFEPVNTLSWYQNAYFGGSNRSALTTSGVEAYIGTADTASARRPRFTSTYFTPEEDLQWSTQEGPASTTLTTEQVFHSFNMTPEHPGEEYTFLFTGITDAPGKSTTIIRAYVDGTQVCQTRNKAKQAGSRIPFYCSYVQNISAPVELNITFASESAGKTVDIRNTTITSFRSQMQPRDMLCYPVPNQEWVVDEPIICDNVTRTTGTGTTSVAANGTLTLINDASITTTGLSIFRWTNPYYVMLERGSEFVIQR